MHPIAGIIITRNEEKNIEACITSIKKVCDEIIVVDSLSEDNTAEIARKNGASVFLQEYLGNGPQIIYGVKKAKNDWILSIDADERVEDEMAAAINRLDLSNPDIAFAFRRRNFVGNHWIKAAGFYPDYVTRLYNKNKSWHTAQKGHAKVVAPKIRRLKVHIKHFTYTSYSHWLEKLEWMTTRDAWAYYEKGKKPSTIRPLTSALGAFFQKLIFKGGIFQGMDGWTVTLTTVMRAYMKYMKLNEIYQKMDKNRNHNII
jgi:glycosyltransferase involved in cell wall biosynthesis